MNDGGPAFPGWWRDEYKAIHAEGGMSLRDYFAAAAMSGILADETQNPKRERLAAMAYKIADAMLEARKR